MIPITVGQEVFVEARVAGGSLSQIGFAQVAETSATEIVLNLDAPTDAESGSFMPGSRASRGDSLEPLQRVRLRMNDDSGAYFADTRVVRVSGTRVILARPDRIEVEWQRMFFRLDVRVPFVVKPVGLGSEREEPTSAITRDLSGGGLRFSSRFGFEIGKRVAITLQLPHAPVEMHTSRLMRATGPAIYMSSMSTRSFDRKSLRPTEPSSEPVINPCTIEGEAHVVRCRMLWTSDQVSHDVGIHFSKIHERTRDRLIAFLLDEQRRRKALGLDEPAQRPRI